MDTLTPIVLISGFSLIVVVGLTLFMWTLFVYIRWRRERNLERLRARKVLYEEAATKIASFITGEQTSNNINDLLAVYDLDAETLAAIDNFLRVHHQRRAGMDAEYTEIFDEVREILIRYEARLQRNLHDE